MERSSRLVFIDECGNDDINVGDDGVSNYYILAAIAMEFEHRDALVQHLERVRRMEFPQAREMKSASIGKNDHKRQRVLDAIVAKDFQVYLLTVDKAQITGAGLSYPKSFVKFLLDRLVGEILRDCDSAQIICDNMKTLAFMEEVKKYLRKRHQPDLFHNWTFDFRDSALDVCIQTADVLAGSTSRCFERQPDAPQQDAFLQCMKNHVFFFKSFPAQFSASRAPFRKSLPSQYDADIEARALNEADAFVNRGVAAGELARQAEVACVRLFLSHNYLQAPNDWIPTAILKQEYERVLCETVADQTFRNVIGRLRDQGLLIASRRSGGYRLPTSVADMQEFLVTQNTQIGPMLRRVERARDIVQRATANGLDILADPEFASLRKVIEAASGWLSSPPHTNLSRTDEV